MYALNSGLKNSHNGTSRVGLQLICMNRCLHVNAQSQDKEDFGSILVSVCSSGSTEESDLSELWLHAGIVKSKRGRTHLSTHWLSYDYDLACYELFLNLSAFTWRYLFIESRRL